MLQCWQAVCADAPLARAKGASLLVLAFGACSGNLRLPVLACMYCGQCIACLEHPFLLDWLLLLLWSFQGLKIKLDSLLRADLAECCSGLECCIADCS